MTPLALLLLCVVIVVFVIIKGRKAIFVVPQLSGYDELCLTNLKLSCEQQLGRFIKARLAQVPKERLCGELQVYVWPNDADMEAVADLFRRDGVQVTVKRNKKKGLVWLVFHPRKK